MMHTLGGVRAEVEAAAIDAGREPDAVRILAVSKSVPLDAVAIAYANGQRAFGESRAQELIAKAQGAAAFGTDIEWHFIGRLQTNKVRSLAPFVTLWQSVDRSELVERISTFAPGARILLQMRLGNEDTKGGCDPAHLDQLLGDARGAGLQVDGLMGIAPRHAEPQHFFEALVHAAERFGLSERSIGMSGDFRVAIRCGSTMVRIGSGIFGSRPEGTRLA